MKEGCGFRRWLYLLLYRMIYKTSVKYIILKQLFWFGLFADWLTVLVLWNILAVIKSEELISSPIQSET